MIKINVILKSFNWTKYIKNPKNLIDRKLKLLNKKNKLFKKNILNCSLLLAQSSEIKKLNKRFRSKNKSTDILSFPFHEKKQLYFKIKKQKEIYVGDIIINLDKVKNKLNKTKFNLEFNKLWIHGLVHLLGYKHESDRDFYTMNKIEKKFLKYID